MKLVIVESPTKAKTLSGILGKGYSIEASLGHIRDLPKSGLGVDIENDFQPEYEVPKKSQKILSGLKKSANDVKEVLLATDPDREGEAIAWHLQYLLTPKKGKLTYDFGRVVFHELTKEAIKEAFKDPGKINIDLVDAQQARRVLDRLVGYKLSPLLWKKVRYGLSAGRVQSVAVRLIVEREREREAFKPEEYWITKGIFRDANNKREMEAELDQKDGKKINIRNTSEKENIEDELKKDSFSIESIKKSERKNNPYPPFKTSTLQQGMASFFGFNANRTMKAAQGLFEKGYITYHRTDSISLAPQFIESARSYIAKEYGNNYLPKSAKQYKTKSKVAQEAHEAIRPTSVSKTPKSAGLKGDEMKVYSMVWRRAIESQMLPAIYDLTNISILSSTGYLFRAKGSQIKFDGWLVVGKNLGIKGGNGEMTELPDYKEGETVLLKSLQSEQKFTQPPARYSDASLIKKMEELGVGRPSTYAPTISTIQRRGYVEREGRQFLPTDVAYVVIDLLVEHFPEIVDYEFTANMEEDLDDIAAGEKKWVPLIREFYKPFEKKLDEKENQLSKSEITTLADTEEICPECGKNLIVKLGKYGKFLSCSGYPDCNYAKPMVDENGNGEPKENYGDCPNCKDGKFILKQGRFGKFLACSNYPDCKTTKTYLEKIGVKCPKCGDGDIIIKKAKGRTFYGCSNYPDCDYSSWKKPGGKNTEKSEVNKNVAEETEEITEIVSEN